VITPLKFIFILNLLKRRNSQLLNMPDTGTEKVIYDWSLAGTSLSIAMAVLLIVSSGLVIGYSSSNISPSQNTIMLIVAAFFIAIAVGCIVANGFGISRIVSANDLYVEALAKQNGMTPSQVTSTNSAGTEMNTMASNTTAAMPLPTANPSYTNPSSNYSYTFGQDL
jgi:hypothetical protein